MSLLKKFALNNSVVYDMFCLDSPAVNLRIPMAPWKGDVKRCKQNSNSHECLTCWLQFRCYGSKLDSRTTLLQIVFLTLHKRVRYFFGHDPQTVSLVQNKYILMENPESHQKIIPNAATCSRCHLVVINQQLIAELGSPSNLPVVGKSLSHM